MSRAEHLQWCKDRAIALLDGGAPGADTKAFTSMVSDMNKHDGTRDHVALMLGTQLTLLPGGLKGHPLRRWITGFH